MMLWDVIHKATQEDGTMLKLMDHIRRGMPHHAVIPMYLLVGHRLSRLASQSLCQAHIT